jgi:hypothetical protein
MWNDMRQTIMPTESWSRISFLPYASLLLNQELICPPVSTYAWVIKMIQKARLQSSWSIKLKPE